MNENKRTYAEFTDDFPLLHFLAEHGRKLTIEEGKQVIHDYFAGKEDWMPVVDE